MIYSILFDTKQRENSIIKKNDCRPVRQSVLALPTEIFEYVKSAKNELVRDERYAAYTTLLASLKCFFNVENPIICHQKNEKPSLISHNIFFNISHCDGIVAVTISDTNEVGVDIQNEPDERSRERLKERFLSELFPVDSDLDIKYYLAQMDGNDFLFYESTLSTYKDSFSYKWAVMESLMKLYGRGFSDLSKIGNLAKKSKTNVRGFLLDGIIFSISNSIKNG